MQSAIRPAGSNIPFTILVYLVLGSTLFLFSDRITSPGIERFTVRLSESTSTLAGVECYALVPDHRARFRVAGLALDTVVALHPTPRVFTLSAGGLDCAVRPLAPGGSIAVELYHGTVLVDRRDIDAVDRIAVVHYEQPPASGDEEEGASW